MAINLDPRWLEECRKRIFEIAFLEQVTPATLKRDAPAINELRETRAAKILNSIKLK